MKKIWMPLIAVVPLACAGAGSDQSEQVLAAEQGFPEGNPGTDQVLIGFTDEQPTSPSDIGAFRTFCEYSHMSHDDPIVFPGHPGASHLHTFFGNTGTDASSTYSSLRNSGNSTCRGGIANRSAYWIPTLLDESQQPMVPSWSSFYYKQGYNIADSHAINHIPDGLRMVAGSSSKTAPTGDPGIAYWGCLNNYVGHHEGIVDCEVGDAMELTVVFPQCWNGVDLDSPDHRSHMAYPEDGACPASHPIALPEISINVAWTRNENTIVGLLKLSSDGYDTARQPPGLSVHADWFDGWDPAIKNTFVDHCLQPRVDCHSHLLGDGRELLGL